jgi:hypothetical protein
VVITQSIVTGLPVALVPEKANTRTSPLVLPSGPKSNVASGETAPCNTSTRGLLITLFTRAKSFRKRLPAMELPHFQRLLVAEGERQLIWLRN